jgi:hypothetical protein
MIISLLKLYVKHENKISIDRRQSKVVKKIFKLKSEGYTITQIQYKTRRAKLSAGQITRILKNVFYIGYIKHKGSYYPHKHGRIV